MGRWDRRDITNTEVWNVIGEYGAPTNGELKAVLATDSLSLRRPLGTLHANNKIFPMAYKGGIVWMKVDGKKGRPDPAARRAAVGKGSPRQEAAMKKIGGRGNNKRAVTPSGSNNRSTQDQMHELGRQLKSGEITREYFLARLRELKGE